MAVAQDIERDSPWFNPQLLQYMCWSVLEWETEPKLWNEQVIFIQRIGRHLGVQYLVVISL